MRDCGTNRGTTRGPTLLVALLAMACSDDVPTTQAQGPVTACRADPFDDVTNAWGIDFVHHPRTDYCDVTDVMGPGACAFDYDRDGDLDLYFIDRAPYPNRLYRNDRGRFSDVTDATGAGDRGDGLGCLAFDYDRDGDEDLYLTNLDGDRLYRNDRGRFTDVTRTSGIVTAPFTASATAGDIDGDGDNDLVVSRFLEPSTLPTMCSQRIEDSAPQANYVFVNQGNGHFTEEAVRRGVVERAPTLAVKLFDLDGDGDLDLYEGNDLGMTYPDHFYMNDGRGHFVDRASQMGLDRAANGNSGQTMGVDLGDIDGDGVPELVSSNSSGYPVLLYHCDRALRCAEVSRAWGLEATVASFNWGVGFEDFDLDGDLDLFVVNGSIYRPAAMENQLFWNVNGRFVEHETTDREALAVSQSGRALIFGDLDGDGAIDGVVSNVAARPQVLRNRAGCGHWLAVRLVHDVAGARVKVTAAGRALERQRSFGGSYLGSGTDLLHFGLGTATTATVEVRWPDGRTMRRDNVAPDRVLVLP